MIYWGHHMGFGGYGFLITAIVWIGLIVLGVWLLAQLFPGGSTSGRSGGNGNSGAGRSQTTGSETPMEILQKRYARGELTREEYETIRHDLSTS